MRAVSMNVCDSCEFVEEVVDPVPILLVIGGTKIPGDLTHVGSQVTGHLGPR